VLADAISDSSTNPEGGCVVKTETLNELQPYDPSPPSGSYACQTISSAPTSEPGSTGIRPPMSIAVTPPTIPSLMSIQTTPPPFWRNDYAFGPRFPTPHRYPMPRDIGGSPTHGGAPLRQLTALMDIRTRAPTPIPALMSIQTSPPPHSGIRPLTNNGSGRGPPRGSRRSQARG